MKRIERGVTYAVLLCVALHAYGIIRTATHEHEWRDATCTEPRTCATCNAQEGEPMGHAWQDATCTEPKTCITCGAQEGELLWHTWIQATCTEAEQCSTCGKLRYRDSKPTGHEWEPPTCTEPETYSRCGETRGEAYGHNLEAYQWETTVEPTCQKEGERTNTCTRCGAVETEVRPMVEHEAGDWTIIQEATSTAPGIRVKLCTMCGAEMKREEYRYQPASTGTAAPAGGGSNFNTYDNEEQQNTKAKYVLNTSSNVFHRPSCRDVPKISPKNYSVTNRTRGTLTSGGWRPCGHCSP